MKTLKRSTAAWLALIAIAALVVPSVASASRVESKKGFLAPKGTVLTMSGSEIGFINSLLGTAVCKQMNSKIEVTVNDGTNVMAEGSGGEGKECRGGGEASFFDHVRDVTWSKISTSKSGSGTASLSFTSESNNQKPIVCHWSASSLPFTYSLGGNAILFQKAGGLVSTGGCGTASLSGSFSLAIGSTPVILN
jgi:hypothetical protein